VGVWTLRRHDRRTQGDYSKPRVAICLDFVRPVPGTFLYNGGGTGPTDGNAMRSCGQTELLWGGLWEQSLLATTRSHSTPMLTIRPLSRASFAPTGLLPRGVRWFRRECRGPGAGYRSGAWCPKMQPPESPGRGPRSTPGAGSWRDGFPGNQVAGRRLPVA